MAGEVLGQLVAGELVGRDDAVHHTGPLEHGEVAVGGALRQPGLPLEQLRDRERLLDLGEQVDERAPLRRVALAVVAQAIGGGGVDGRRSSVVRVVVEDQGALADAEEVPTVGIGEVGLGEHVVRRAAGHHPPGQQQQVVGGGRVAEVVGGHHARRARRPARRRWRRGCAGATRGRGR